MAKQQDCEWRQTLGFHDGTLSEARTGASSRRTVAVPARNDDLPGTLVSLPDDHHVVWHVSYQQIDRDDVTGAIRGIFPQAFELLPKDEGYPSASWL
jgi:hypothetical protein